MLRLTLFLFILFLSSCSDQLSDFSNSKIQYRVISLTDSVRRPLIDLQFKAMNDSVTISNSIKNAAQQNPVTNTYFDAILGKNLNTQQLIQDGYYTGSMSNGE